MDKKWIIRHETGGAIKPAIYEAIFPRNYQFDDRTTEIYSPPPYIRITARGKAVFLKTETLPHATSNEIKVHTKTLPDLTDGADVIFEAAAQADFFTTLLTNDISTNIAFWGFVIGGLVFFLDMTYKLGDTGFILIGYNQLLVLVGICFSYALKIAGAYLVFKKVLYDKK